MEPRKSFHHLVTREALDKALDKVKRDPEYSVEGCHYEIAREGRHQKVVDFIRDHFIPDEPIAKCIAHTLPWNPDIWMSSVKENMSLILVSDTTNEIVAVRVNKISKKTDQINELHNADKEHVNENHKENKEHNNENHNDKAKPVSDGRKKLEQLGEAINSLINVYEHYNVEEVIEFMALAVHKDFRQRGIGLKIMNATLALIKNLDLGGVIVKGEGSGNYVNKIFEKACFDFLGEVVYKDFKVDGEIVFKDMGEHRAAMAFAKFVY